MNYKEFSVEWKRWMTLHKQIIFRGLIGLGVAVLILCLSLFGSFDNLELKMLDYRFQFRGALDVTDELVIIAIDDRTLRELKQLKVDRALHAGILWFLGRCGAKAIAYDIAFAQPDIEHPDDDKMLIDITQETGNVCHAIWFFRIGAKAPDEQRKSIGTQLLQPFALDKKETSLQLPHATNVELVLKDLLKSSRAIGHINLQPDDDGVNRRVPMMIKYNGSIYPALALAVIGVYLDRNHIALGSKNIILHSPNQKPIKIPVDRQGRLLINYVGSHKQFKQFSLLKVSQMAKQYAEQDADAPPSDEHIAMFKDKIVLIGSIASGDMIYHTPFTSQYPNLYVHADTINSILQQRFLHRLRSGAMAFIVLLLSVSLAIFLGLVRPKIKVLIFIASAVVYATVAFILFAYAGLWIDVVSPMLSMGIIFMGIVSTDYFHSFLREQQFKQELEFGRRIQQSLLPTAEPQLPGIQISAKNWPHQFVTGDYYDFLLFDKEKLGIIIGDVTGEGVAAGLFMTASRAAFRIIMDASKSPAEILNQLNRFLYQEKKDSPMIKIINMTFLYGILDLSNHSFNYSSAGHWPPLLYRSKTASFEELESHGFPLGASPLSAYKSDTINLELGDILVFYTDGITEASNKKNDFFEVARLQEVIKSIADRDAEYIRDEIVSSVTKFTGGAFQDDVTLIVLKVLP